MKAKLTVMFIGVISASLSIGASAEDYLDEIVVTATKREAGLQDIPIAVSVVQQEDIQKAAIEDLIDLQSVVPSLRVEQIQRTTETAFFVRGFGNGSGNIGLEPSVGVFIDGVYRSRSAAQLADLPNLERIEVLRGPQSTLFGKNASAGVVSIVTGKPSFERNGYVQAGAANYNGYSARAYVTGPVTQNTAFSLGGSYRSRDGYIDNIALGTDIGDRNRYTLRGQLLTQPSDKVEIRLIADFDELDEVCCGFLNTVNGPTSPVVDLLGGQVINDPFGYRTRLNSDPTNDVRNSGLSVHVDTQLGAVSLQSITAYRGHASKAAGDVDFTDIDLLQPQVIDLDIESFSQEIRLTSNNDGPLNWLAGAFFYSEALDQSEDINYGTAAASFVDIALLGNTGLLGTLEALSGNTPGTFFAPGTGSFTQFSQDNDTLSIFGQVDFELTDRLLLTAGVSYVRDKKDVAISQINTDIYSQLDLLTINTGAIPAAFFGAAFLDLTGLAPTPDNIAAVEAAMPGTTAAIQASVNATVVGLGASQFTPPFPAFPNAIEDGKTDDDSFDYSVRLALDLTDQVNVYVSYATGFKASSFNLSTGSRPSATDYAQLFPNPTPGSVGARLGAGARFARPEESEALEFGLKAAGDTWRTNIALFEQSIEDFQSSVFLGTAFGFSNAEKQSVRGLEFDASWSALDSLTLSASGAYLDAEYDRFTGSPAGGDISGSRPGNVSEFYGAFGVNWDWALAQTDGYVRVNYQYESDVDTEDGGDLNSVNVLLNGSATRQRGVSTVNASVGVNVNEHLSLSFWSRNLFNDEYVYQNAPGVLQPGSVNAYPSQPRTFGATLRYTF